MDTRDQLIRAGVRLLETEGLPALSLRKIAEAAGVSHGAPRHHFPTYNALLAAIARCGLDDLDARFSARFKAGLDARGTVTGLAQDYLAFSRERPEMFQLIVRHDLLDGAGGDLRQTTARWFDQLIILVGGPADALALWSGIYGIALLSLHRSADPLGVALPSPEVTAQRLIDRLLDCGVR